MTDAMRKLRKELEPTMWRIAATTIGVKNIETITELQRAKIWRVAHQLTRYTLGLAMCRLSGRDWYSVDADMNRRVDFAKAVQLTEPDLNRLANDLVKNPNARLGGDPSP